MTQTFADIIDLFGYAKLADALGRPEGTVSSWKTRNSIPPEVWSAVVAEAKRRGIKGVSLDLLARMRAERPTAEASSEGAAS